MQRVFNEIKGTISEINEDNEWCSVTIESGKNNPRQVNFVGRGASFSIAMMGKKVGDEVMIRFYVASRKSENGRWYTNAHLISCYLC